MAGSSLKLLITIKEAAELFGVTPQTIRNWDRKGKLKASRHPMNNYRLYNRRELEKIVRRIEK
jgi:excisionase family DNA binding protein